MMNAPINTPKSIAMEGNLFEGCQPSGASSAADKLPVSVCTRSSKGAKTHAPSVLSTNSYANIYAVQASCDYVENSPTKSPLNQSTNSSSMNDSISSRDVAAVTSKLRFSDNIADDDEIK